MLTSNTQISKDEALILDPQGYKKLKENLEASKQELTSIVEQKVQVRQDEDIQNIDDPSATWHLLLAKEASLREEISRLELTIMNCKVVEEKRYANVVCIGDTVNLTLFFDDGEIELEQIFKLVTIAPNREKREISKDSPIGSCILGRKTGDKVLVKLPEEHWMEVLIVSKE